jgi:hypothetical protein
MRVLLIFFPQAMKNLKCEFKTLSLICWIKLIDIYVARMQHHDDRPLSHMYCIYSGKYGEIRNSYLLSVEK